MSAKHSPNTGKSPARSTPDSDSFEHDLVALIPDLRAFSRMLCRNRAVADDMAQEALANAWRARNTFEAGTNMRAWLFRILRNGYYSHVRRASRESHWDADAAERIEAPAKEQEWAVELSDTVRALHTLPDVQRDAVILVGAAGVTYQDAAAICGTRVGTLKSRVARGRTELSYRLGGNEQLPRSSSLSGAEATTEIQDRISVLLSNDARAGSRARSLDPREASRTSLHRAS
jgi:RNA polymerase sigma-70 factor (ECF subfamily)